MWQVDNHERNEDMLKELETELIVGQNSKYEISQIVCVGRIQRERLLKLLWTEDNVKTSLEWIYRWPDFPTARW
jgi:hypothetical protein